MPENAELSTQAAQDAAGHNSRRPAGPARLLPAVAFGLGTAALAGVVVGMPVAPGAAARQVHAQRIVATATLGAAISELTGQSDTTTCCHN